MMRVEPNGDYWQSKLQTGSADPDSTLNELGDIYRITHQRLCAARIADGGNLEAELERQIPRSGIFDRVKIESGRVLLEAKARKTWDYVGDLVRT